MKWLNLIFFSALCLFLPQLLKREFKVPPSLEAIAFNEAWETTAPDSEILAILRGPFTYLTRGNQSLVLASQDGRYVLKLFRYTRSRFPLIQHLKCWTAQCHGKKPKNDLFTKTRKTFDAVHLGCTRGKEFTQALFCHVNLTEGKLPIVQCEGLSLPLDRLRFVLQKRTQPFKETLLAARADPEEMHRLIDSFVSLIVERSALGIRNSDPNLGPNFGFLDGKAVEIDFGNYRNGPQRTEEIRGYLCRLEQWLCKNAPEHVEYLHGIGSIAYDPANENAKAFH